MFENRFRMKVPDEVMAIYHFQGPKRAIKELRRIARNLEDCDISDEDESPTLTE